LPDFFPLARLVKKIFLQTFRQEVKAKDIEGALQLSNQNEDFNKASSSH
jgi:hypothetical protein